LVDLLDPFGLRHLPTNHFEHQIFSQRIKVIPIGISGVYLKHALPHQLRMLIFDVTWMSFIRHRITKAIDDAKFPLLLRDEKKFCVRTEVASIIIDFDRLLKKFLKKTFVSNLLPSLLPSQSLFYVSVTTKYKTIFYDRKKFFLIIEVKIYFVQECPHLKNQKMVKLL
jgi:hypothetical protein